ncbi:MAG: DUF86 domain-containing protein [Deltaproteobacteria bacterium]|nr:DUF86 domain-containing protein [Deltaproteobacteria bacterium]
MVDRSYKDYLQDILDAMNKAQGFVGSMDYEVFQNDDKTAYAVIRALEVIGEATKHVPDNLRQKYTGVPWQDMAGMRDVLIHAYFGVDIETVWLTVTEKISQIKPLIEKVLKETGNEKG